jgi:hypothetical protein
MERYMKEKIMPPREKLEFVHKALKGSRSIAKIRTRINNMIHGKQMCM